MITAAGERHLLVEGINALGARRDAAERGYEAARRELEHVLALLPYEDAKSGKYKRLRRRLELFLSERIEGL